MRKPQHTLLTLTGAYSYRQALMKIARSLANNTRNSTIRHYCTHLADENLWDPPLSSFQQPLEMLLGTEKGQCHYFPLFLLHSSCSMTQMRPCFDRDVDCAAPCTLHDRKHESSTRSAAAHQPKAGMVCIRLHQPLHLSSYFSHFEAESNADYRPTITRLTTRTVRPRERTHPSGGLLTGSPSIAE